MPATHRVRASCAAARSSLCADPIPLHCLCLVWVCLSPQQRPSSNTHLCSAANWCSGAEADTRYHGGGFGSGSDQDGIQPYPMQVADVTACRNSCRWEPACLNFVYYQGNCYRRASPTSRVGCRACFRPSVLAQQQWSPVLHAICLAYVIDERLFACHETGTPRFSQARAMRLGSHLASATVSGISLPGIATSTSILAFSDTSSESQHMAGPHIIAALNAACNLFWTLTNAMPCI
jgi:hypothetical protein